MISWTTACVSLLPTSIWENVLAAKHVIIDVFVLKKFSSSAVVFLVPFSLG